MVQGSTVRLEVGSFSLSPGDWGQPHTCCERSQEAPHCLRHLLWLSGNLPLCPCTAKPWTRQGCCEDRRDCHLWEPRWLLPPRTTQRSSLNGTI